MILGSGAATALSEVPHDIVVDRCYVHGTATADLQRGIVLNGARQAVVDSWVSDVHSADIDSQAILGWAGPGPFKIVNNYLEASGENVMFGGADPVDTLRGRFLLAEPSPVDVVVRPGAHEVAGVAVEAIRIEARHQARETGQRQPLRRDAPIITHG